MIVPDGEDCVVHVISRCVRQAWLCGKDKATGRDYGHRRGWVKDRIQQLAGVFAVEVCAYAVMSNHSHMVLWCRPGVAAAWSAEEVARRWLMVFGPRRRAWTEQEIAGFARDDKQVAEWRARLSSVSWFMRCLNECIARQANKEDGCKGRFWEGRFKSQLLADDGAVLACMAYVDLNPVRAKVAGSLEESGFTSVKDRITGKRGREKVKKTEDLKTKDRRGEGRANKREESPEAVAEMARALEEAEADAWLCPMGEGAGRQTVLDMSLEGYLALVEWTGQAIREDKRGALPEGTRTILGQMELDVEAWVETVREFGRIFHRVAGKEQRLRARAGERGQHWVAGVRRGRRVYRKEAVA
jgi:REP element-mobilizing transposase RayT